MNVLLVFLSLIGLASPWGGDKVLPLQPMEDPAVVAKLFGPIKYGRGELSKRRACGMDPVASWVYWFYEGDKRRVLVPQRWGKCGGSEGSIRLELYDVEGKRARLIRVSRVYEGITHVGLTKQYREVYPAEDLIRYDLFHRVILLSKGGRSFGNPMTINRLGYFEGRFEDDGGYWYCDEYENNGHYNCLFGGVVSYLVYQDVDLRRYVDDMLIFVVGADGIVYARTLDHGGCGEILSLMSDQSAPCDPTSRAPRCRSLISNWQTSAIWYGLGHYVREPVRMDMHGVQAAEHLALWMYQHYRLWPPQRAALIAWSLWMWHVRPDEAWSRELLGLARDLALGLPPGSRRRSALSSQVSAGLIGARAATRR